MVPEPSEPPTRPTFVLVSACINLLLVIACATMSGLSIAFADVSGPFAFFGGICLLTLCIPAGVLQYLAVFGGRHGLLPTVGATEIAIGLFIAFGAVTNIVEALMNGAPVDPFMIEFALVALAMTTYFLIAGWSTLMWGKRILRSVGFAPTCPRCEYDLRGTLAAGIKRCPECGWSLEAQPSPESPTRPLSRSSHSL